MKIPIIPNKVTSPKPIASLRRTTEETQPILHRIPAPKNTAEEGHSRMSDRQSLSQGAVADQPCPNAQYHADDGSGQRNLIRDHIFIQVGKNLPQ